MDQPDGTEPTLEAEHRPAKSDSGGPGGHTPGDRVDRYIVDELLGAGGMGAVYRAKDARLGRLIALKLLNTNAAVGSDTCRELCHRLMREATAMAKLSHPNLVTVYDVGTHDGRVYIAMELVEGETLRQWSKTGHPWSERLEVLMAAGRGLLEANNAGVLHRDFKPDNVLIGEAGQIKVADFGLALSLADERPVHSSAHCADLGGTESSLLRLTRTGAAVGTPIYMSPEQHDGRELDARSDQFNFAASAWEVLYGRAPFPGRTLAQLSDAVHNADIVDPPAESETPRAFIPALRRAMHPQPENRFASVGELLDALDQARNPRGILRTLGRLLGRSRNDT